MCKICKQGLFMDIINRIIKLLKNDELDSKQYATKGESEKPKGESEKQKIESILFKMNNLNKFEKEKLKSEYVTFLDRMEKTPVDITDPNVQKIYANACNFIAIQTFTMLVSTICDNDADEMNNMKKKVLNLFFSDIKHTLYRSIEVNELIHDNKFSRDNIGDEIIERFNKCNSDKISKAVKLAESLMKQTLHIDEKGNLPRGNPRGF